MKKVLITGVNGYIGGKIAAALLGKGYEIVGIDKADVSKIDDIKYIQADITERNLIEYAFDGKKIDCLIHLAALVHNVGKNLSKDEYKRINTTASEMLFECAARHKVKEVLFASTIEVYGEQEIRVVNEGMDCNPASYYAISKYDAEKALIKKTSSFERYAIMRFAPVYAPDFRLNLDKRFYMFGKRFAFYFKDGEYSFNFCEVGNIIDFVLALLEGKGESGIYNISDEKSIAAKEFIKYEKEYNGLDWVFHMPYGLCYMSIAVLECLSRLFSSSEPFFSRYNFRKLFKSTVYDSKKARENVAQMQFGIKTLYE